MRILKLCRGRGMVYLCEAEVANGRVETDTKTNSALLMERDDDAW